MTAKVQVKLRVSPAVAEAFAKLVSTTGMTRSALVMLWIAQEIANLAPWMCGDCGRMCPAEDGRCRGCHPKKRRAE